MGKRAASALRSATPHPQVDLQKGAPEVPVHRRLIEALADTEAIELQGDQFFCSSRAMTRRWMSLVPS
jgi:hypothetical protein